MRGSSLSLPTLKWNLLSTGLSLIKFQEIKYKFVMSQKLSYFILGQVQFLCTCLLLNFFLRKIFCSRIKKYYVALGIKSWFLLDILTCNIDAYTIFNKKEHDKITLKLWYFFIEKVEINFLSDHPYFSFNS